MKKMLQCVLLIAAGVTSMAHTAQYSADVAAVPGAKTAGEPNMNTYRIKSTPAPAFTPVKAWDDGKFTFIELVKPYHGELPIVLALAEDGSRSVVNFQWDEQNARFVVQRVLQRAVLVLGDKSVVVSRT